MSNVRCIGLDVHAETIAVAIAEPDGEVRSVGVIPNRPESIRQLVKKLGPAAQLRVCYEAGPTGYVVYWQLTALGVTCEVLPNGSQGPKLTSHAPCPARCRTRGLPGSLLNIGALAYTSERTDLFGDPDTYGFSFGVRDLFN
jgi:hypothetical protein